MGVYTEARSMPTRAVRRSLKSKGFLPEHEGKTPMRSAEFTLTMESLHSTRTIRPDF